MRIYEEGSREKLSAVICNQCGKKMKVENGILMEGCCHVETPFPISAKRMATGTCLTCVKSVMIE